MMVFDDDVGRVIFGSEPKCLLSYTLNLNSSLNTVYICSNSKKISSLSNALRFFSDAPFASFRPLRCKTFVCYV